MRSIEENISPQVSNGTDNKDWKRDPSPPQPAVDEEEDSPFAPGGLEVDIDINSPDLGNVLEVDGDVQDSAASVYAMSSYPRMQPEYQVEQPFENGIDGATIDSSRTLYAEDVDYITVHGRTYVGDYFIPIDATEQTRQYVQHQVFLKLFDLELTTVPLDNPSYILDIGTGIGEWAIGMAEKYPECEVFGTDIAPIQPTQQVPFNIEFHIENAEDEWIRPANAVDLVHFRNMAGAFADWSFIYQQAFECLRPGGWIEIIDYDDLYTSQDFVSFYPPESRAHLFFKAFGEAMVASGRKGPGLPSHMDEKMLIDTGFVDLKPSLYDLGIGTRENASFGKLWLFSLLTGFEAVAMRLLTRYLGWEEEYVRELCNEVAQETREIAEDPTRPDGFVVKLRVLVGRKPTVPGQWTAKALNEDGSVEGIGDYTGSGSGTGSGDESTIGSMSRETVRSEDTV
ncbi:S-adenosyl-L-methionine-dependent methyltransferase [Apodospora peruviana]|uniref:S-adenosyl-L-methionine-dependent methyltransferase n=1 Tax=Apodospora peruviana TaxID=516989 RepID=A0AAE0HVV5_9PEZI|nr:S-adenosyl-L-methionine-dependent methyltransferase [Apodospora peruviana]